MICGNCKEKNGVDREHVRACYAAKYAATATPVTAVPAWTVSDDVSAWTDDNGATAYVEPSGPVTESGLYRKGEDIFKVQVAVHGSGRLYAKRFLPDAPVTATPGEKFEYAPGVVQTLRAEDRLTLDEAKQYGALYGSCIVCGRTLTDENSIAAGIGPVCANKV